MPNLLLHEERVEAILHEVRDIRMPQAVQVKILWEARGVPVLLESSIKVRSADAPTALSREQHHPIGLEQRTNLGLVLGQHLNRTRKHRQHRPALGRATLRGLPVPFRRDLAARSTWSSAKSKKSCSSGRVKGRTRGSVSDSSTWRIRLPS